MSTVPQRLGPWEVLGAIAQGGQGAVLRARDPATGTPVALKLLLRSDAKALRRFRQEAQVLERLDHPGIVRVLGHGDEDGVPWLAMALVEGETLRARVERDGPLAPSEAVRLVAAMARALAHAHALGIVHRDLKPENVIVERASGLPVLVDFGLLRRDAEVFGELSIDAHSRLSKTGELRGTPAYMAPEQVSPARFGGIGPGTDVYGLGGVLYFLLTGAAPHEAEGLAGVIYQILESTASPDPCEKRPALPRSVVAEVRRALAPMPADRHPSAAALADALERLAGASADGSKSTRGRLVLGLGLTGLLAAGGVAWVARSPTPALETRASPGSAPSAAAPADEARQSEAARDLAAIGSGAAPQRLARARAWLAQYGGLPGEERARAVLREAGHEAPLLEFHHGLDGNGRPEEARARWLDGGARFLSWGHGHGEVRLWSLDAPQPLASWDLHWGLDDVAVLASTTATPAGPAREVLVVTRAHGTFALTLAEGTAPRPLDLDVLEPTTVACAPDGRVVLGDTRGGVFVLDRPEGQPRALPAAHRSSVCQIRFSADGRWLATGSGRALEAAEQEPDNRLVLWDAARLVPVTSQQLPSPPSALAFSGDGRWLAVGTTSYRLYLIDLRDPQADRRELAGANTDIRTLRVLVPSAHAGPLRGLAFLPDGTLRSASGAASLGAENGLRGWDPATGLERPELTRAFPFPLVSLDATPDGRLLIGDGAGGIGVWAAW